MTLAAAARPGLIQGLSPERLRRSLIRLGPIFVKIGQYLALRPDILDQSYCDELLKLVDRVPPEPFPQVRATITAALSGTATDHFEWISSQAIGSGSLAQVYPARTRDGDEVAVKVQRSDIAQQVRRDIRRLRWLARLIDNAGALPGVRAAELATEIERWMSVELDCEQELSNLLVMHARAQRSTHIAVPRPYPGHCGPRVVTTEYFAGVPFSVLLRHAAAREWREIAQLGIDRSVLARALVDAMLEQIFRWGIFHADVHPGNVIALPDNRVGFVDFGLVETLEPRLQASLLRYVRAIYLNETEEMFRAFEEALTPGPRSDPIAFRDDFFEQNRQWQRDRMDRNRQGSPLARYMIGVLRTARRHDMRLPSSLLAIYRSLVTAEMVATALTPGVDLTVVGRRFFRQLELEQLLRIPDAEALQVEILRTVEILRNAPSKLDRLLTDLTSDRLRFRIEQVSSSQDRRLRSEQARMIVLAILVLALANLIGAVGEVYLFNIIPASFPLYAGLVLGIGWLHRPLAAAAMSGLIGDLVAIERAGLTFGAVLVRSVANFLFPAQARAGSGELTPAQLQRIRMTAWRLQAAFEALDRPISQEQLQGVLGDVAFLAESLGDQFVAWIGFLNQLVSEAERLYGAAPGRGAYKQRQVKAAILYLLRRADVQLPSVPTFLQPAILSYAADVMIAFVVAHVNVNGLWESGLPARPAKMSVRLAAPVVYRSSRAIEGLGGFLTRLAWRIVLFLNRLAPELQAAVDRIRPDVDGVLQALGRISRFSMDNPDLVRAVVEILSIATQQAEMLAGLTGPQKQAYARELILDILEQNGVDLSGLWGSLVTAWVDVTINATVELFNSRGLFHHGKSRKVRRRAPRSRSIP